MIPEREPERRLPLLRWAAGAQIAQCQHFVARQQRAVAAPSVLVTGGIRNGCYPDPAMSINWRASLVPAAAVIPAPRVYTNIAAVETLVVDARTRGCGVAHAARGAAPGSHHASCGNSTPRSVPPRPLHTWGRRAPAGDLLQWWSTGRRLTCGHGEPPPPPEGGPKPTLINSPPPEPPMVVTVNNSVRPRQP